MKISLKMLNEYRGTNHENNVAGTQPHHNAYGACDSYQYDRAGTNGQQWARTLWGQTCNACDWQNHSAKISQLKVENKHCTIQCIKDAKATMDNIIVYVMFEIEINTYTLSNSYSHEEVEATLIPFSPHPDPRQAKDITIAYAIRPRIYPDCRQAKTPIAHGTIRDGFNPHKKRFSAMGRFSLVCWGWLCKFTIKGRTTKQAIYVQKIQVL